jgi:hypothetical protein
MRRMQRVALLITLGLWVGGLVAARGQQGGGATGEAQKVLSLNRGNDGKRVTAAVGQRIEIKMQTIGGGQYGAPEISSPAVRGDSPAFVYAKFAVPAGPTQIYGFTAVAEGEARIRIRHTSENATFTVTVRVKAR